MRQREFLTTKTGRRTTACPGEDNDATSDRAVDRRLLYRARENGRRALPRLANQGAACGDRVTDQWALSLAKSQFIINLEFELKHRNNSQEERKNPRKLVEVGNQI
jgi:hypothetical protein